MDDLKTLRNTLEQRKGRKMELEKRLSTTLHGIQERKRDLRRHDEARVILNTVALETQNQLSFHIGDITSLALNAVFPHPYNLKAEFVSRRNKTECDLVFERDGETLDPISASGGGAVDVAAFALRVASWSMQTPRSRSVIILDEPFRYLSEDLLPQAGEMLQQISEKLELQIIMVTHSMELMNTADLVFHVSIKNGKSQVRTYEN